MNKKLDLFLNEVCRYIRYKTIHEDVRNELTGHIEDLKNSYKEEGQNEDKALDMAIADMGDCGEIGRQLDKQHRPKTEWSLIALTTLIAIIGGIVMFASSKFGEHQTVNFINYLVFVLISVVIAVGLYFFDYNKLKRLALPIYIFAFTLLIITPGIGADVMGRKFLVIGNLAVSSEYATILFLIAFAGFIDKFRGCGNIAILYLIGIGGASLLPVIMLPRISQVFILLIGYGGMLLAATLKQHFGGERKLQLWSLGGILSAIIIMFIVFTLLTPYRLDRITTFISRGTNDPMGMGYQQTMADQWLSVSKLFGKATELVSGNSIEIGMPSVTTDYVLINVIATLGWVAGIALVLVVAALIFRMLLTTKKINSQYGFYLSFGACTILSAQFVISILMSFNLLPPTSISLPFISYGGTGYIVSAALVGIILSVWRRNNLVPKSSEMNNYAES